VEHLIQQRFELPAFSTLDRLVMRIRHQVHQDLYTRITASFGTVEEEWEGFVPIKVQKSPPLYVQSYTMSPNISESDSTDPLGPLIHQYVG
jgi:hypothetical protein